MRKLTALLVAPLALAVGLSSSAHAQRSSFGVDWSCGYDDRKDYVAKIKRANQDDLSCLAGAGLWREALPRIGGRMDETRQRLSQLLALVLDQDPEAEAFFLSEIENNNDEAVLWLLIARGERGLQESDRRTRSIAVNLLISLPPWAREQFGSMLADALLAEGDSRAAITLATALRTIAYLDEEKAQAAMIRGRVLERFGSVDEAVALYQEASELGSARLSAEAELRKIALMWRSGYIRTEEAVVVLRELVTIWRGQRLGADITLALARAYYFDQQFAQSLRLLVGLAGSNAPDTVRNEAERRIASIADDLFVRRLDPSSIGDLMDVYELVRPMIGPKQEFWMGDLRLSEVLVRAGLMARAEDLMQYATAEAVSAAGGQQALMEAAAIMIRFDRRAEARSFIGSVSTQQLSDEDRSLYDMLEARALEVEQLAGLVRPGVRRDVLTVIGDRAWAEEAYGLYGLARSFSDEPQTWREPAADYLAQGTRVQPDEMLTSTDPRYRALSSAPKPSIYYADDLRPLLDPSAEVVGLASTLTQIGQELQEAIPEAGDTDGEAGAKDETTL